MSEENKSCFVISPIGEAESDVRKRSDQVLRHIIRPAVEACGYKAIRADEIDKPGIITSQVIQHVVGDPLVIADLTDTNPNVFYELAIRHAIRKPLVQIIKKGERIPFDVAGTRTIHFDHHDLDSVEAAKEGIVAQIKASEENPNDIETPISVSLDLQFLRQSENPEERSLADLVSAVTDVRSGLSKLEDRVMMSGNDMSKMAIHEFMEVMPRRIAKELGRSPKSIKNKRAVDPYLIKKLTRNISSKSGSAVGILVALSFYKDQMPWLYEIGMEAYRRASSGDWDGAREIIRDMRMMTEMSLSSEWVEEWIGSEKEAFMLMEELPMLLERMAEDALMRSNHITKKSS
ncbi:MAG: hypothetical protein ABW185_29200 [Sedimenticola sp.]